MGGFGRPRLLSQLVLFNKTKIHKRENCERFERRSNRGLTKMGQGNKLIRRMKVANRERQRRMALVIDFDLERLDFDYLASIVQP